MHKPDDIRFPPLDEFVCFALYSASHAFNQFYRPLLDKIGLTYPQYLVMVSLWAKDDITVKDLGQKLFLESSTLTPLLKRLEGRGLIRRERDPSDERQVRLRLTQAGRDLRSEAVDIPTCVQDVVGLSKEEFRDVQHAILDIRNKLLAVSERDG